MPSIIICFRWFCSKLSRSLWIVALTPENILRSLPHHNAYSLSFEGLRPVWLARFSWSFHAIGIFYVLSRYRMLLLLLLLLVTFDFCTYRFSFYLAFRLSVHSILCSGSRLWSERIYCGFSVGLWVICRFVVIARAIIYERIPKLDTLSVDWGERKIRLLIIKIGEKNKILWTWAVR